jgi:hypothetical protein
VSWSLLQRVRVYCTPEEIEIIENELQ